MDDIVNFIIKEVGSDCTISFPRFERNEKRDFEYVPYTVDQFYGVIKKAPWDILKGMGFSKWASMNNLIEENNLRKENDKIEIPFINSDGKILIDMGKKELQKELLEIDEYVILFPGEWFNVIPKEFIVTGLFGESYEFDKNTSDDDIRYGCLPYGFRRVITKKI